MLHLSGVWPNSPTDCDKFGKFWVVYIINFFKNKTKSKGNKVWTLTWLMTNKLMTNSRLLFCSWLHRPHSSFLNRLWPVKYVADTMSTITIAKTNFISASGVSINTWQKSINSVELWELLSSSLNSHQCWWKSTWRDSGRFTQVHQLPSLLSDSHWSHSDQRLNKLWVLNTVRLM